MRRLLAASAKILRRAHQPLAKQPQPNLICRHAERQRIGRIDEPAGQVQAIWVRLRSADVRFAECAASDGNVGLDFVARLQKFAPFQQPRDCAAVCAPPGRGI